MSTNPNEFSPETEAARICQPLDELIAKEADELQTMDAKLDALEEKVNKLFPPAKRADEQ